MQVKQLFPGFEPNSILRFSSLLGPPRISVAARLWAGAKRPQKRPPKSEGTEKKLDPNLPLPPEMLMEDDEVGINMHPSKITRYTVRSTLKLLLIVATNFSNFSEKPHNH